MGSIYAVVSITPVGGFSSIVLDHGNGWRSSLFGMSEVAVSTEVFRMRKRYREIFDRELEKLIGSKEELEAEKRFLFASLSK